MLSNQQIIMSAAFILSYILILSRKINPTLVVLISSAALILTDVITLDEAVQSINLNVLGIVWGTMVLAELFIASKATDYLAGRIVGSVGTARLALVAVSAFAGLISAFIDNVATVLIIAPVAIDIATRLKVSPAPFLISVAISSNLQGMATMIGDSTSIILASAADMNFMDFFWFQGRPSIFFAVEIGALFAILVLWILFRKMGQRVDFESSVKVQSWIPSMMLTVLVFSLAALSFVPVKSDYAVGIVTVMFGVAGIVWNRFFGNLPFRFKNLDWNTIFFLVGIFVLVGSLSVTGIVTKVADLITGATGGSTLTAFIMLVGLSVVVSAFIDNIPYTIAMLPIAQQVADSLGASPILLMFGLLIGTSLGGNITPIGASANVVAVGMLRRKGVDLSAWEFVKVGLPFTLAAVISASLFVWILWA